MVRGWVAYVFYDKRARTSVAMVLYAPKAISGYKVAYARGEAPKLKRTQDAPPRQKFVKFFTMRQMQEFGDGKKHSFEVNRPSDASRGFRLDLDIPAAGSSWEQAVDAPRRTLAAAEPCIGRLYGKNGEDPPLYVVVTWEPARGGGGSGDGPGSGGDDGDDGGGASDDGGGGSDDGGGGSDDDGGEPRDYTAEPEFRRNIATLPLGTDIVYSFDVKGQGVKLFTGRKVSTSGIFFDDHELTTEYSLLRDTYKKTKAELQAASGLWTLKFWKTSKQRYRKPKPGSYILYKSSVKSVPVQGAF